MFYFLKAHCEPEDMASYPMAIDNFACDFDVGFFLSKEECCMYKNLF